MLVVEINGDLGIVDPDRLRTGVARELSTTCVAPADPRAAMANGRLSVDARSSKKTLTVSFRSPSAGLPVTRSVVLPDSPRAVESSAVILAGNVARDEAADVLSAMKAHA